MPQIYKPQGLKLPFLASFLLQGGAETSAGQSQVFNVARKHWKGMQKLIGVEFPCLRDEGDFWALHLSYLPVSRLACKQQNENHRAKVQIQVLFRNAICHVPLQNHRSSLPSKLASLPDGKQD